MCVWGEVDGCMSWGWLDGLWLGGWMERGRGDVCMGLGGWMCAGMFYFCLCVFLCLSIPPSVFHRVCLFLHLSHYSFNI